MNKILFNIKLTKDNIKKRDYILKKISEYLDPLESSILEIGIGNGRFGFLLSNFVKEYFGIDPDNEYVNIAKTNIPKDSKIEYKVGSAEEIPYKRKFDIILFANSWHFIKDFNKAITKVDKVLNKTGIIIILEPSENTKKWASPKLNKDSNEFDEKIYEKKINKINYAKKILLEQNKFKIIEKAHDKDSGQDFYILKR